MRDGNPGTAHNRYQTPFNRGKGSDTCGGWLPEASAAPGRPVQRAAVYGLLTLLVTGGGRLSAEVAEAATYYVSPSGSGTTCSSASPCSLDTGLDKAFAGDEVVLKDGVYNQRVSTRHSGNAGAPIIIRAANLHQAIIRAPSVTNVATFDVDHRYITIRGLTIDGAHIGGDQFRILNSYSTPAPPIEGVIFEYNHMVNSGLGGFHMQGARNILIRHNIVDGTGYNGANGGLGEGFYLSTAESEKTWHIAEDIEIYGNRMRDTTNNIIDIKKYARNIVVHHNIFEDHVRRTEHVENPDGADDGLIRSVGSNDKEGNRFENNIRPVAQLP